MTAAAFTFVASIGATSVTYATETINTAKEYNNPLEVTPWGLAGTVFVFSLT